MQFSQSLNYLEYHNPTIYPFDPLIPCKAQIFQLLNFLCYLKIPVSFDQLNLVIEN
jgi:hypothetical protein